MNGCIEVMWMTAFLCPLKVSRLTNHWKLSSYFLRIRQIAYYFPINIASLDLYDLTT